jgi:hypothetical protein
VELQDQLEVRPLELWMANADVTSKKVGALPSLMMGCARFMGFHILYKYTTLEALDPVSRCDRDWVGLTENASAQGYAALRGPCQSLSMRRAIR